MPDILTDADGVLCDFLGPTLVIANRVSGMSLTAEDIRTWDVLPYYPERFHPEILAAIGAEGFVTDQPAIPGAQEALEELRVLGNVWCVTSPWTSRTWAWERTGWLNTHMRFTSKEVLHVSAKHLVDGDVLIDDKFSNLVDWKAKRPQGTAILIDASYNANEAPSPDILRAHDWQEVIAFTKAALARVSI